MKRVIWTGSQQASRAAVAGIKNGAIDVSQKLSLMGRMHLLLPNSPIVNPVSYAFAHPEAELSYSPQEKSVLEACANSTRMIVSEKHLQMLQDYFTEQSKTDTVMGRFYRTMTFNDFLSRLYQKRFRSVYLDGNLLVPRDINDVLGKAKRKFNFTRFFLEASNTERNRDILLSIGTESDRAEIYKEYLCLNELMLTPVFLPQTTSIIVGTGSRSTEWAVQEEARASADLVVLTSAVAPEFGDGYSLHLDLLFCVVAKYFHPSLRARNEAVKADQALVKAARTLYGPKLAIEVTPEEASQDTSGDFIPIQVRREDASEPEYYWLYKPAYVARMRPLLKTLLLSSDEAMQAAGTGPVFNLKGLGLGAFGFSDEQAQKVLEDLYIEVVQEVLSEIADVLQHIRIVNLINLSRDRAAQITEAIPMASYGAGAIRLVRSLMSPTEKTIPGTRHEIGGTVFCGDSAALVGNEGQIGFSRDNSDDPATLYSMLDPSLFAVERLSSEKIVILDGTKGQLKPLEVSSFSSDFGTPAPHKKD